MRARHKVSRLQRERMEAAAMAAARQDSVALREKALTDTIEHIIKTVPLSPGQIERLNEILDGGAANDS